MLRRATLFWHAPSAHVQPSATAQPAAPVQPAAPAAARWAARLLAAGLVLATAAGLLMLVERESLIGDSLGYLHAAQRIAAGFGPTYDDPNNALAGPYFSLFAFQIQRPDTHLLYLGFPPGLSLLLALPLMFDPSTLLVHWVVPFTALATLLLSGWLAWLVTQNHWAPVWTMLLLAVTPALWFFGTAVWSEFPSAAAITGASALYLYASGRPHRGWVELVLYGASGLLLAYSVFIRYSNVVVAPVLLLYDGAALWRQPGKVARRWPLWLLIGLAVAAIPLFNHVYYGGWNLTSYSPVHGWYPMPAFSPGYAFGPSFVDGYSFPTGLATLWRNFGLFLLLAPVGWVLLRRTGALLAGAALATFAIYAIYAFAPAGLNARFLIPAMPMLAVGAAVAVVRILERLPRLPAALLAVALLLLAGLPLPGAVEAAVARNAGNGQRVAQVRAVAAATPADAVFLSYPWNDLLAVYGGRSVFNYRRTLVADAATRTYRTEQVEPTITAVVTTLLEEGKPVYFVELESSFLPKLPELLQTNFASETITVADVTLRKLSLTAAP